MILRKGGSGGPFKLFLFLFLFKNLIKSSSLNSLLPSNLTTTSSTSLTVPTVQPISSETTLYSELIFQPNDPTPNKWSKSSKQFNIGAMFIVNTEIILISMLSSFATVCQVFQINSDPDILNGVELQLYPILQISDKVADGTAAGYGFSVDSTENISVIGPLIPDYLFPIVKYYNAKKISVFVPFPEGRYLSFGNSRANDNVAAVSNENTNIYRVYMEMFQLFGWQLISAAFSHSETGKTGRYEFAELTRDFDIQFPCYMQISGSDLDSLKFFEECILSFPDSKVIMIWASPSTGRVAIEYLSQNSQIRNLQLVVGYYLGIYIYNNVGYIPTPYAREFLKGVLYITFASESYQETFQSCKEALKTDSGFRHVEFYRNYWSTIFQCRIDFNDYGIDFRSRFPLPICSQTTTPEVCYCERINESYDRILPIAKFYQDAVTFYALALDIILNNCTEIRNSMGDNICELDEITGEDLLTVVHSIDTNNLPEKYSNYLNAVNRQYNTFLLIYQEGSAIGLYTDVNKFVISKDKLNFKNNSQVAPISIIVPSTTNLSSGYIAPPLYFGFAIAFLVVAVIFFLITIWYRHHPVFENSGILFLTSVLLGIILSLVAGIVWTMKQYQPTCTWKAVLTFLGIAFIFPALVSKSLYIYQIFAGSYDKNVIALVAAGCFLYTIIVFFLYYFIGGLPTLVSSNVSPDPYYRFIACQKESSTWVVVILSVFAGTSMALLCWVTLLLIIARRIEIIDGENWALIFLNINIIYVVALLFPLYFIQMQFRGYDIQQYLLRSVGILFIVLVTLAALFVPKIYILYKEWREEEEEGERKNRIT